MCPMSTYNRFSKTPLELCILPIPYLTNICPIEHVLNIVDSPSKIFHLNVLLDEEELLSILTNYRMNTIACR